MRSPPGSCTGEPPPSGTMYTRRLLQSLDQGCADGPFVVTAILVPSGDQLRLTLWSRDSGKRSLRPLPSGRTSQSESRWSMYAIRVPLGDHAYEVTIVPGGV